MLSLRPLPSRASTITGYVAPRAPDLLVLGLSAESRTAMVCAVLLCGMHDKQMDGDIGMSFDHYSHSAPNSATLAKLVVLQVWDDTRNENRDISGWIDIDANREQADLPFSINTDGWEPGFYKVCAEQPAQRLKLPCRWCWRQWRASPAARMAAGGPVTGWRIPRCHTLLNAGAAERPPGRSLWV